MEILLYFLLGTFSGILAGLFGIGGGLITVPILFYIFSASGIEPAYLMHLAVGTSFGIIIPTSVVSVSTHHQHKAVDFGIVKGSPEIIINSQKYDYNFAKKNTLFFSISEISTLKNNDVSISNIKYTMDLSQKRNAESLGKNGFLSNLHFTD